MRAYFLIFAFFLLPHLVLLHPGQPSYINKVFARRTRNSPKYIGSTPRHTRISRYIQEPELQEVQQKLQQSTDDVDLEQEIEQQQQLTNTGYGAEKGTTKSTNGYTQTPFFSETSTARPQQQQVQQQIKDDEDELSQLSQPLSQQQGEFENAELSQNYMPTQELSYSPVKQMKERARLSQPSYGASSYGGSNGANYGGSAGSGGSGFGGSANSESLDDFGFSEDDNTIGSMKDIIRGEPGKDYPVFSSVPTTGFKCSQQSFPGYYGDVEAQCQVFHICQADGRSNAFLCPNGTIFSQRHFVCVWWYEFDCSTTEQFYDLNAELFKESEARAAQGTPTGGIGRNGGIVGGSVPSGFSGISSKLNSPKENLNKMYMAQIDEFNGVTTSAPSYYGGANGKTSLRGNSNGGFKGLSQTTQQPVQQYESSVESVTPSILDSQNYETTPYNLDEALGEEIHSETPIIEALSLTTNIPKLQSPKSYGSSARKGNGYSAKGSNGNSYGSSKGSNGNYYGSTKSNPMSDFGFGDELSFTSPKPSYGGSKGKSNGKTSPKQMLSLLPEAPVKGSRNGGSTKSTKSMYSGTGNGNGLNSLKSPASNGFKSYSSPSSYGGLKQ